MESRRLTYNLVAEKQQQQKSRELRIPCLTHPVGSARVELKTPYRECLVILQEKENWKLQWRKRKEKEARELASQHLRRRCGAKSTSLKPLLINCNHWEPLLFFFYLTAFHPFEEIEQFSMSLLEDNITSCILPNRKNHTKSPFLLPFRMYTGCMCAGICISICMVSFVQLFATPWTVAHQVPLSMEFSSQKYWSG